MAVTAAVLIQRTRRLLRDYREYDNLTASCASGTTTLTVADATTASYSARDFLEIDSEVYRVVSGTGTTLTVKGAQQGSTTASHASGAVVYRNPAFYTQEIFDALNDAVDASWPALYSPYSSTDTTVADTFEYTIPSAITRLVALEYKPAGTGMSYKPLRGFTVRRDNTSSRVKLNYNPVAGDTLRFFGFGPFARLATTAASTPTGFPDEAASILPLYAASVLLASGEAGRVRADTGLRDDREAATKSGSSISLSNQLQQRFYFRLGLVAMPPLPRTVSTSA